MISTEDFIREAQELLEEPNPEITLGMVVEEEQPIIKLNGTSVLSPGNILLITARPGLGKSQVCEIIDCAFLNPNCDAVGFEVELPPGKTVIHIDTERTKFDCIKGLRRIARRVDAKYNNLLTEDGERLRRLYFGSFISLATKEEMRKELEALINENVGLVILDGGADFIDDPNDLKEASNHFKWLIALANKYEFGVIVTVHDNPSVTGQGKARGHYGSEALRKAQSSLLLKRAPDDKDIRLLTTDFEHAKNRNDSDNIQTVFVWSESASMFVTADYIPSAKTKNASHEAELFEQIISISEEVAYSDLVSAYKSASGKSEATAKRHISSAAKLGIISQNKLTSKYHLASSI